MAELVKSSLKTGSSEHQWLDVRTELSFPCAANRWQEGSAKNNNNKTAFKTFVDGGIIVLEKFSLRDVY